MDQTPLPVVILAVLATVWHFTYLFAFMARVFQFLLVSNTRNFRKLEGRINKMEIARRIQLECWWVEVHVAYPFLIAFWFWSADNTWDYVTTGVNLFVWWDWYHNHDHDDRWKKRRKKAASKVKQLGGKLVVVPVPAGSGA